MTFLVFVVPVHGFRADAFVLVARVFLLVFADGGLWWVPEIEMSVYSEGG